MHRSAHPETTFRLPALVALVFGLIVALTPSFNPTSEMVSAATASATTSCTTDNSHLVAWQDGHWFLSGVNIPWQNNGYGADFATIEEWGQHTYSSSSTQQMFTALQSSGVNTVRWWVFADGRGAPEFSSTSGGAVTGLDDTTLSSMADAIKLAAQYNIHIVF
ncbi:MAG: hypothetical protein HGA19_15940, partial [Oscillochloris sp.]|nr:hypothetical protein [Oscillochloris sp.]